MSSKRQENRVKRQHYVPKMLLKHFCPQGSDHLWVYDKHTGKIRNQAIREIGHETYFNEAPLGDGWRASYEEKFQHVENIFAPVLVKLNGGASLHALQPIEFARLCYFIAVQHLRTPANFSWHKQFNEEIRLLFPDNEISPTIQQQVGPLTDDAAKLFSLNSLFSLAEQIANALVSKSWAMHKAHSARTFYIGDTPIALHNDNSDEFRSTLGFKVPGIQIFMPTSATTLVGAYCPVLAKEAAEIYPTFHAAFENGTPIQCEMTNMDFFNSLQVSNAERFIYSRYDNFEFAKDLLQQNPTWKKPIRLVRL